MRVGPQTMQDEKTGSTTRKIGLQRRIRSRERKRPCLRLCIAETYSTYPSSRCRCLPSPPSILLIPSLISLGNDVVDVSQTTSLAEPLSSACRSPTLRPDWIAAACPKWALADGQHMLSAIGQLTTATLCRSSTALLSMFQLQDVSQLPNGDLLLIRALFFAHHISRSCSCWITAFCSVNGPVLATRPWSYVLLSSVTRADDTRTENRSRMGLRAGNHHTSY